MSIQSKKEEQLSSLYYTPNNPASFSGAKKIYEVLRKNKQNISIGDVKKWLKKQEVYTSHRKIHRKFKRNKFISYKIDYIWDADVCIMDKYKEYNKGYKNFFISY